MFENIEIVDRLKRAEECFWINPKLASARLSLKKLSVNENDVEEARARLKRFEPFISKCFPETAQANGMIESPLTETPDMINEVEKLYSCGFSGRLFAKRDCDLPIAGSVKARGGIYEVLKHAEELALAGGIIKPDDDYSALASSDAKAFFSKYAIQVGSTGNLGLSIGITSAALGFKVTVHMSSDAKQWKKELLRAKGVNVVEYASDYSAAVVEGRRLSDEDPMSYFIDDENSKDLFMGYAVAAKRLKAQLDEIDIKIDEQHPLFVYIPCGVGGGPGGIAFGLKLIYGDAVHVFFVEPVQAPCMLLGMATGLHNGICVQDIGLTGATHADGLAVGRASGFVGKVMDELLSGEATTCDGALYDNMRALYNSEGLFAEPSSCAAYAGVGRLFNTAEGMGYIRSKGIENAMGNSTHIVWLTGGRLVPEKNRKEFMQTRL